MISENATTYLPHLKQDAILYSEPNINSEVISALSAGERIKASEHIFTNNETHWRLIDLSTGRHGYLLADTQIFFPKDMQLDQKSVNVVEKPSESSEFIYSMKSKSKFILIDETNGWLRINQDGIIGFIPSQTRITDISMKFHFDCMKQTAILYSKPDTNSEIITTLLEGEEICHAQREVINFGGKYWRAISDFGNRKGYVLGDTKIFFTKNMILDQKSVNILEKPNANSKVSTILRSKSIIHLIDELDGWYKVYNNKIEGYIPSQTKMKPYKVNYSKIDGKSNLLYGSLLLIAGIIFSSFGVYLFWGAILLGIILILDGLVKILRKD